MSKLILLLFGVLAGWLLSEGNRELLRKKIQEMGIDIPAPKTTASAESIQEKIKLEDSPLKSEEVFQDALEKIKGVGPVIKGKLNDNGIFTFAQLGALTPQALKEILGASLKRLSNKEEIIRQAQEFAK